MELWVKIVGVGAHDDPYGIIINLCVKPQFIDELAITKTYS